MITVCDLRWYSPNMLMIIHNNEPEKSINGDRLTLMQYTGIKDKDGVEIYEGDILTMGRNTKNKEKEVVRYVGAGYKPFMDYRNLRYPGNYKVIGNIYENSELILEVSNNG